MKTLHAIMSNRLKPRSALRRIQTSLNKNEKSTDMSMTSRYMLYLIHSANVSYSQQSCELNKKNFVNLTTTLHIHMVGLFCRRSGVHGRRGLAR